MDIDARIVGVTRISRSKNLIDVEVISVFTAVLMTALTTLVVSKDKSIATLIVVFIISLFAGIASILFIKRAKLLYRLIYDFFNLSKPTY
jgi:uncharacterized membrane protein YczE